MTASRSRKRSDVPCTDDAIGGKHVDDEESLQGPPQEVPVALLVTFLSVPGAVGFELDRKIPELSYEGEVGLPVGISAPFGFAAAPSSPTSRMSQLPRRPLPSYSRKYYKKAKNRMGSEGFEPPID